MTLPVTTTDGDTLGRPQSAAVVSATRGSGRSLLTAVAGLVIDQLTGPSGQNVFLMDADARTAGLTRLLAPRTAGTGKEPDGLRGFAAEPGVDVEERPVHRWLHDLRSADGQRVHDVLLLPVTGAGAAEAGTDAVPDLPRAVGRAAAQLRDLAGCLLVDCPAGWGEETQAVCAEVDHIIVLCAPGAPAAAATAELVRLIVGSGLTAKVSGCVRNTTAPAAAESFGPVPLPVLMTLPHDPDIARVLGTATPLPAGSPLVSAITEGLRTIDPVLLRTTYES